MSTVAPDKNIFFLTCTHLSVDAADGISSKNTLGRNELSVANFFQKLSFW